MLFVFGSYCLRRPVAVEASCCEDEDADEGAWWLLEEAEVDEKLLLAAEKTHGRVFLRGCNI